MDLSMKEIEVLKLVKNKYSKIENGEKRYNHILGVAKLAKDLAIKYGVDEKKAIIAGYMHDYFKYESIDIMREYLKDDEMIKECEEFPVLFHAYCSAEALKREAHIDDIEIYNAIKYHVCGHKPPMTLLDEIILISDYAEENRQYESCIKVRNILLDGRFYEALYYSFYYTNLFLTKKGYIVHPNQKIMLNYYKEKMNYENVKTNC